MNRCISNTYPRPLCSAPVIIFNRNAVFSLISCHRYYKNGQCVELSPAKVNLWSTQFDYKYFNRIIHSFYLNGKDGKGGINWQNLESWYTIDFEGKVTYLFLAVPCGHCDICNAKRQNDFTSRVNMESAVSYTTPIMVTLTYDEEHLPVERLTNCEFVTTERYLGTTPCQKKWVYSCRMPATACDGVNLRPTLYKFDTIRFFNILRKYWIRNNYFPTHFGDAFTSAEDRAKLYRDEFPFRYVCVGEYGSKNGRPHYHLILWNVPYNIKSAYDFSEVARLKSDIIKCWRMCASFTTSNGLLDSHSIQCEVARDCGKYVGKYVSKNCPNGRKGFMCCSNGNGGGIGHKIIDNKKEFIHDNPQIQYIDYISRNGVYNQYTMGRYATKRLFPSPLSLIPSECKQYCRYMVNEISDISQCYSVLGADVHEQLQLFADALNIDPFHILSRLGNGFHSRRYLKYYDYLNDIVQGSKYDYHLNKEIDKLESRLYYLVQIHDELKEKYHVDPLAILKQEDINKIHNDAIVREQVTDDDVVKADQKARVQAMDMLNKETF